MAVSHDPFRPVVAWFRGHVSNTRPEHFQLHLPGDLTEFRVARDKREKEGTGGPEGSPEEWAYWSFCVFRPGTIRKDENVAHITAFALDCDPKHLHAPPEKMQAALKSLDISFSTYSTWSGGRRYILPISRPVTPAEYAVLHPYVSKLLGGAGMNRDASTSFTHDPCIKIPSQPYFTPTRTPDVEGVVAHWVSDEGPYDVDDALRSLARQGKVPAAAPVFHATAPNPNGLFAKVLQQAEARKAAGDDGGFSLPSMEAIENYDWISRRCGFVTHCETNAATLGEQEWYAWLSLVGRCKDGRAIAHRVSSVYPGYSVGETDNKLTQATTASGPRTCADIATRSPEAAAACAACPFNGQITSPIVLGKPDASEASPEEVKEDLLSRSQLRINKAETELANARKRFAEIEGEIAGLKRKIQFAPREDTAAIEGKALAEKRFEHDDAKRKVKFCEKELDAARAALRSFSKADAADPATFDGLTKSTLGRPENSHHNVRNVLASDPAYRERIWYDGFRERVMIGDRGIDDDMESDINLDLQGRYNFPKMPTKDVSEILRTQAKKNFKHPVREYLRGLKWDGVPRLASLMKEGFGAVGDELYLAEVGTRILISAVARVLEPRQKRQVEDEDDNNMEGGPGCKVDTMLVLVGGQGRYKSECFKRLLGKNRGWFSDTRIDLFSKDAFQQIRGKWIYEVQEMDSQQTAEKSSLIKAFLTSDVDNFRKAYGRNAEDNLRQLILVGTTNHDEFLSDPTGDRRFVPVSVTIANPRWIGKHRDQLWAEAVMLYDKGEAWWWETGSEAEQRRRDAAAAYHEQDPWLVKVLGYLANVTVEKHEREKGIAVEELLEYCVMVQTGQLDKAKRNRMSNVLRALHGKRRQVEVSGRRIYKWQMPEKLLAEARAPQVEPDKKTLLSTVMNPSKPAES